MTRRRFLRATSLTLLILCLAAWGWSYLFTESIAYYGTGRYKVQLNRWGFQAVGKRVSGLEIRGWRYFHDPVEPEDENIAENFCEYHFLGFHWHCSYLFLLHIPTWFPTLLLAALTCWTWRKTRAKDGRGFAVEPDQLREESREKTDH